MRHEASDLCPDSDVLAAFAEGKLTRREQQPLLGHIQDCVRCTAAIEAVSEDLFPETATGVVPSSRRPWLLAAAAVVALGLLAVPVIREIAGRPTPMARLVALAPRTERRVEPRITGGFAWAEYGGAERSSAPSSDPQQLKLAGAAGELVERAAHDGDAEAQHAAGVAMLLVESPSEAVEHLEKAAANSKDPKRWSDLAAARYAAASKLGQASLYTMALAAADTALRENPSLAEALFNRALILERLGRTDEARRAWQRYLEVDASSPWAGEARTRLAAVPPSRLDVD